MRKRSPRVAWFPGTNANSIDAAGQSAWNVFQLDLLPGAIIGDTVVGEVPITIDGDQDPLSLTNTLADIENQGYRLRRIVGKIFCLCFGADNGGSNKVGVTAGFIIRRINPQTGVSLALSAGLVPGVAPSSVQSQGDPWIWRRSWLLDAVGDPLFTGVGVFDNYSHGPAAVDGPHIDQKTARIVSSEERLFLDVSMTNIEPDVDPTTATTSVKVYYETRILGSMRATSGNRRNASR